MRRAALSVERRATWAGTTGARWGRPPWWRSRPCVPLPGLLSSTEARSCQLSHQPVATHSKLARICRIDQPCATKRHCR
jgi:hypothetical protein